MWAGEARVRNMFKWMTASSDKQVIEASCCALSRCWIFQHPILSCSEEFLSSEASADACAGICTPR